MGSGRLLDNEEVEFLLKGSPDEPAHGPDSTSPSANREEPQREVTMRGDLDKMSLSDIFQTLAMSKMEGLLRVRGPIESREIHFHDGYVRCVVPRRVETLRLGQRLVRAGLVTAEQLRSALLEQRKSRASIGDIFVEQQLVSAEDIEEIVCNQLQEDLFALFTWPQGTFEFYKGEITDPVLQTRLDQAPAFEVNGVLLEVARRSDEWMRVMSAVGCLDEIVTPVEPVTTDGLDEDCQLVLESADGTLSVRDLADTTLIGLFDCGRIVRELLEAGYLRKLTTDEVIDTAARTAEAGEPRRAVISLRALLQRDDAFEPDTMVRLADLFARCGESRQAAQILLAAAQHTEDHADAMRFARHARSVDRHAVDVLAFLAEQLGGADSKPSAELHEVLADLTDALADLARYEEALTIVTDLEASTGDLSICRPRRARILSKLGRTDEAVESLLGLAELHREAGAKERVAAIYEQILKIDYRRKDIARALKSLHAGKLARRGKLAAVAAVVLAIGFGGYIELTAMLAGQALEETGTKIDAALARGDVAAASALLQDARAQHPEPDAIAPLQAKIDGFEASRVRKAAASVETARTTGRTKIVELLRAGNAQAALDSANALAELGIDAEKIAATLRESIDVVRSDLDSLDRDLPAQLPGLPSLDQTTEQQTAILENLRKLLTAPELHLVEALYALRQDKLVRAAFVRDHAAFVARIEALEQLRTRVQSMEDAYAARVERRNLAKELTPLFHEAREQERLNKFEAALESYRTLLRNHPEDDDLRAHFEERVERYSSILRFLDAIEDATSRGDFASAQGQLRAIERQFPNLPFDAIARLPVLIKTTPPGAHVFVDGKPIGDAPIRAAYHPAAKTTIRIELDGFQPEETTLTGDSIGVVRSLLARLPRWTTRRQATIDRAPTVDGQERLFVTDRNGTISGLRARDGALLWSQNTEDLSGLLTSVRLAPDDRLIVGSIDGPLRCMRRGDGAPVWTSPNLPTESSPLVLDGRVIVGTDDARLVAVAAATGEVIWTQTSPGPIQADLIAVHDRLVVALTTLGTAVGVDPTSGQIRWKARVGRGAVSTPAVDGGAMAIASEDGHVTLLDLANGTVRWSVGGFSNLSTSPCIANGNVFVPDGRELHLLTIANGTRRQTLRRDADLTSNLSTNGSVVFVGDGAGVIEALDAATLEPRYVLRADGPALAPVIVLDDGTLVAAFQDRTIRAYGAVE